LALKDAAPLLLSSAYLPFSACSNPTFLSTAKKLLSFTDNRQDASLQAGHFNDFIEVGLLRSALYKAVHTAGAEGLRYDEVAQKVFAALNLPLEAVC
jgi:hypothetical protein